MSDTETIARALLQAWNDRDWTKLRDLLHPDYTYTGGDGQKQKGAEAGLAIAKMFASAFPDGKIETKHVHISGHVAIVEFIGRGTHTGELMGIAGTGKTIELPVCDVIVTRDGKIYAEREYMDMMTLMQQLGVAGTPATA